jgi:starch synthase
MDIAFLSAEIAPWVKASGLGDVASALPKALKGLGHRITVVAPKFAAFDDSGLLLARRLTPIEFEYEGKSLEAIAYDCKLPSQVELTVLEVPCDLRAPYEGDTLTRYGMFSAAAAALLLARVEPFDVVHLNDWHTANVAALLKAKGSDLRTVLTVHSGAEQGRLTLGGSLLENGLKAADAVTTVSATYARELCQEPTANGLAHVYAELKVYGIQNGIDYAVWNPATDVHIASRFDAEDASLKPRCVTALQRELGFEVDPNAPIVSFVGRLVPQKGVSEVLGALPALLRATSGYFVIVGHGELAKEVQEACAKHPERVRFLENAAEAVVHRVFAGSSIVLVPSVFEPCGLVQMYAQRYGAIPVGRAVGGLVDTIVDTDASLETGTGVLFDGPGDFLGAVLRAVSMLTHERYPALVRRMMRLDRGWDRAARQLERVYRSPGDSSR